MGSNLENLGFKIKLFIEHVISEYQQWEPTCCYQETNSGKKKCHVVRKSQFSRATLWSCGSSPEGAPGAAVLAATSHHESHDPRRKVERGNVVRCEKTRPKVERSNHVDIILELLCFLNYLIMKFITI